MRGEHSSQRRAAGRAAGSSPHARGAPILAAAGLMACRIIPACAGSTIAASPYTGRDRDHPRMRGEHGGDKDAAAAAMGSSPHARGAHYSRIRYYHPLGIIPACAGSTVRA